MNSSNKLKPFEDWIDLYLHIAAKSGFKYGSQPNKYVLSGYPSAICNAAYFSKPDVDLLKNLMNEGLPFVCFAPGWPETDLKSAADKLAVADSVVTHEYDNLSLFSYEPNSNVTIKQVENDQELAWFDEISGECFEHPKGIASNFLKKVIPDNEDMVCAFLAYRDGTPVGTVMTAFVNNAAGLYWLSVLSQHRKQGIATELVKYAINQAKQRGFDSIISQNLTASQKLFQGIGFKPVSSLPLYIYSGAAA